MGRRQAREDAGCRRPGAPNVPPADTFASDLPLIFTECCAAAFGPVASGPSMCRQGSCPRAFGMHALKDVEPGCYREVVLLKLLCL